MVGLEELDWHVGMGLDKSDNIFSFLKSFWSKKHSLEEFTYRVRWEASLTSNFLFDPDSLLILYKDAPVNIVFSALYHFFIFN